MNDTRVSHITYHLLLVFVAFLWGTNVIVMKWGFNYFSPEQFNLFRVLLAFP
ncbi:MAG: EamA family transporter, partial [Spirochaetota bacterium]